jgi:uncharacterized membrane protein
MPPPTTVPSGARPPALLGFALVLALLVGLIELGVLEYTYEQLGIDHRFFGALLFATLLGSLVNVPIGSLGGAAPDDAPEGGGSGDRPLPETAGPRPTLLAVNVGGALMPAALSIWLLVHHGLLGKGTVAVAAVAILTNLLARPVRGLGIAVPILAPPLAAAAVALVLDERAAAALAYAAGTLGTLVGADLLNLGKVRALGAPVVSIGGAGTFDGVFLSGVIAVLIA